MRTTYNCFAVREIRNDGKIVILNECETEEEASEVCQEYNAKGDYSYQVVKVERILVSGPAVDSKYLSLRLPLRSRDGL